jgi:hypothetical protein
MPDDTTTIRIEKKIDMISSDITGLKVDVEVLKTNVDMLKTNTSGLSKMLTKDSATDLMAYAIGEHKSACGNQTMTRAETKARTKFFLALAGILSVGAGALSTYLLN